MRFVQITDPHLVPHGGLLHGLDPVRRLEACIADINRYADDLGFCVITGDLANGGELDAYRVLREVLQQLTIPHHLILGNHDRRGDFLEVFPESPRDDDGFIQYRIDSDEGVLLLLDTVDEGKPSGLYCEARRRWLSEQLSEAGDRPVYLFMHHPPFDIGFPSLDRMKLDDAGSFASIVTAHPNVRHLFFGHVHRPLSGSWRGIPFSALPGTNHQIATDFEAVSPMPFSHGPPAYAFIQLEADHSLVHLHSYLDDYPRRLPDKGWTGPPER